MKGHSSNLLYALPIELVRMICEFGASQSQETAANLVCVSKAVRGWIAPLLYETVILNSAESAFRFYETIQVAKSSFACHVRRLYLPSGSSLAAGIPPSFLANFPMLQHLAISALSLRYPEQPLSLQCTFPRPRSITITGRLGHISFKHPIFQRCTHLYLADDVPAPLSLTSEAFPCLTHLACGYRHGSSSTAAITCLTLLLPRKNIHPYAHRESQPSTHPTYPVELEVLLVEMYLSNGHPDATMFVTECLGQGKKASETDLRADPRLVLRPGIALTPTRWENYVTNDILWTTAEREIKCQSVAKTCVNLNI